jgi:hypothetical protein
VNASAKQVAVVRAKLKFATREEFIQGFSPLVSRAGLFIKTKNTKEEGTAVRFEFKLADESAIFVGEGLVRKEIAYDPQQPSKPCGMLIAVRKLNRSSKEVWDELLARKGLGAESPSSPTESATPKAPIESVGSPVPAAFQPAPLGPPVASLEQAARPAPVTATQPVRVQPPASPPEPVTPASPVLVNPPSLSATSPAPIAAPPRAVEAPSHAFSSKPATGLVVTTIGDEGSSGGLFGDDIEDELDDMFAEAGLFSSDSKLDFDGPLDLGGSALPQVIGAREAVVSFAGSQPMAEEPHSEPSDSPESSGGGGGLISLDDDEVEDDDDDELFASLPASAPAESSEAPVEAEPKPDPVPLSALDFSAPAATQASEARPRFNFGGAVAAPAPSIPSPAAEPSLAETSEPEPSLTEDSEPPAVVSPAEVEDPLFAPVEAQDQAPSPAQAENDELFAPVELPSPQEVGKTGQAPKGQEQDELFAPGELPSAPPESTADEPGPALASLATPITPRNEELGGVVESDAPNLFAKFSGRSTSASAVEEVSGLIEQLDREETAHPPAPPPRPAPPPEDSIKDLLSDLQSGQPTEGSGLLKAPAILDQEQAPLPASPDDDLANLVAAAKAAPAPALNLDELPPPPSNTLQNPLDSVSLSSAELPPPPAARGFVTPSLDDLKSDKPQKKKGLFNKLFGKE